MKHCKKAAPEFAGDVLECFFAVLECFFAVLDLILGG